MLSTPAIVFNTLPRKFTRRSLCGWSNSISGVLYQSGAFSALGDGQYASTNVPDSCRRAAVEAYNGSDPTYGCIYYYNPAKTSNRFMLSRPIVITIGAHVFCK